MSETCEEIERLEKQLIGAYASAKFWRDEAVRRTEIQGQLASERDEARNERDASFIDKTEFVRELNVDIRAKLAAQEQAHEQTIAELTKDRDDLGVSLHGKQYELDRLRVENSVLRAEVDTLRHQRDCLNDTGVKLTKERDRAVLSDGVASDMIITRDAKIAEVIDAKQALEYALEEKENQRYCEHADTVRAYEVRCTEYEKELRQTKAMHANVLAVRKGDGPPPMSCRNCAHYIVCHYRRLLHEAIEAGVDQMNFAGNQLSVDCREDVGIAAAKCCEMFIDKDK